MKILLLVLILFIFKYSSFVYTSKVLSEEHQLRNYLLEKCDLDSTIRPVAHFTDCLQVELTNTVLKFFDVNDHETSYVHFYLHP